MSRTEYLKRVQDIIERKEGYEDLPATAPVVAMFAEGYMPGDPSVRSGDNMTSLEIVQALEDTCALTTTDVAAVMVRLGYRLNVNDYRGHEWAMRAVAGD